MSSRIRKSKTSPTVWKRHMEHYRRVAAGERRPVEGQRVGPDPRAMWSARCLDGSRALLCERHLTAQLDDVRDVHPAKHGLCAVCTAPPVITAHVIERWQERVDPSATTDQAKLDVYAFLHGATVAAKPPVGIVSGCSAMVNPRWPGVLLVKRNVEPPVFLTVLVGGEVMT